MKPSNAKSGRVYRALVAFGAFIALVLWLALVAYWRFTKQEHTESKALAEYKTWAITTVQKSAVGTASLRTSVAADFTGEAVTAGECEHWDAFPIWRGSTRNPNWVSRTKGADAYRVVCDSDIGVSDSHPDEIRFVWDVSTGRGSVTSFSWSWSPDFLDP